MRFKGVAHMKTLPYRKEIPVASSADVVVVGGGLGGVAAALAAARSGASVVLIETNGFLGGVATAGLCCSVFNCLFTRERELKIKGIPLEITDALATRAGGPGMSYQKHKGHIIYDVEKAKLVLSELLTEAKVEVRLNSSFSDVVCESSKVKAVIVSGRNGLEAITCKTVVDASGDCDVAVKAGVKCREMQTYPASYVFRLGNVDVDKFINYFRENPDEFPENMDIEWTLEEALKQYDENGTFLFPHGGGMQMAVMKKAIESGDLPKTWKNYHTLDATQMHLIRDLGVCHVITGFTDNGALETLHISKRIAEGMQVAQIFAKGYKKHIPGFENCFVCNQADDMGVRVTRSINGYTTLKKEQRLLPTRFDDAVGVGVMMKEITLNKGEGAWPVQVFGDDVYEIPLSCLIPREIENVIIGAGRGADTEPAGVLRVMVDTMSVGQAAGVAAAVSAENDTSIINANYKQIREKLQQLGVSFPEK